MVTTVFRATPFAKQVDINLEHDMVFEGDEIEEIEIGKIVYGSTLIFDTIPSLKKIKVSQRGAIIYFKSFPENPLEIIGEVSEIKIKYRNKIHSICRNKSNSTIPFSLRKGFLICRDSPINNSDIDCLILLPENTTKLQLNHNFDDVFIIGDQNLSSITVKGTNTINRLIIENCSNLSTLLIKQKVLTCSISGSRNLKTVSGFGDRLIITGVDKSNLCIGGFWHEVPSWYDEIVSMLGLTHFSAHLNGDDIQSCDDLGGINITPFSYDGSAGMCRFSDVFNWPIEELDSGIPVLTLVEKIIDNPECFSVFSSWCSGNLSLFQQYVAMRALASLSSRGFDHSTIMDTRTTLLNTNSYMPKILNASVNSSNLGGKWLPMYTEFLGEWETPNNSVIPFGRLDLEIWLNSDEPVEKMLERKFDFNNVNSNNSRNFFNGLTNIHAFRSLIVSILSASNTFARNSDAEKKLTILSESLYTNQLMNTDPFICEFTIYHINSSRCNSKSIVKGLVKGISGMRTQSWVKAALLIGVINQTNSSKARVALQRIASDKEFNVEESNMLCRIALEGKNSFENGTFDTPKWPYVRHWERTRRALL